MFIKVFEVFATLIKASIKHFDSWLQGQAYINDEEIKKKIEKNEKIVTDSIIVNKTCRIVKPFQSCL